MINEFADIRLTQNTSRRIIAGKIQRARESLTSGNNVRVVLHFRESEAKHAEQRLRILGKIALAVKDVSVVEMEPAEEDGRTMIMMLRPA